MAVGVNHASGLLHVAFWPALASACVVALCAGSAASADARCQPPPRARIVARDRVAVVWRAIVYARNYYPRPPRRAGRHREKVFLACLRRSGRTSFVRRELYPNPKSLPEAHHFVLGGRYMAFALDNVDYSNQGDERIFVYDLLRRRRTLTLIVHEFDPQTGANLSGYSFLQLAVSKRGFVGWRDDTVGGSPTPSNIFAHDSHGTRRLDGGSLSDLRGPTFAGELLHWTNGGQAKSAPLS